ncbi:MAG: ribokinase [Clostridia bacterium]|nr:ribokinase [Clostridia bacterium]
MKKRILVIGSSNMDFVCNTEKIPEAGETLISNQNYMLVPGGKGGNTAIAAARLGADCVFCARLGNDSYGKSLYEFYKNEGIDVRHVHIDREHSTGIASIIVEENGDNRIIVYPGANMHFTDEDIEGAVITYPGAAIMQLEIDFERVVEATRLCNARDIPVVIDAGAVNGNLDLSRLGKLEIFTPNEIETEILTGIKPVAYESCIAASIALRKLVDTKYVVLKLGDKGCFVYDGKYANFSEAFKINAVDTTAAGDSFTAALTLEYLRNKKNILEAARYANATGAMVSTKQGASSSIPRHEEVVRFIENWEKENML